MSQPIIIIIATIIGVLYGYLCYKTYKRLKHIPNKIAVIIMYIGLAALGYGLYILSNWGLPLLISSETNISVPIAPHRTKTITDETFLGAQNTGVTQNIYTGTTDNYTGDMLFSGLTKNEEEVVSWKSLREKLQHVKTTETYGRKTSE